MKYAKCERELDENFEKADRRAILLRKIGCLVSKLIRLSFALQSLRNLMETCSVRYRAISHDKLVPLFALQNQRRAEEARQQALLKEPPEISWENTLGSPNGVPFDDDTKELLKRCLDVTIPPPTNVAELIKRSDAFPVKFPISTMRCAALRDRGIEVEAIEVCTKLFDRSIVTWFRDK